MLKKSCIVFDNGFLTVKWPFRLEAVEAVDLSWTELVLLKAYYMLNCILVQCGQSRPET